MKPLEAISVFQKISSLYVIIFNEGRKKSI